MEQPTEVTTDRPALDTAAPEISLASHTPVVVPPAWSLVDAGLWLSVILVGGFLRLSELQLAPLSTAEAAIAWAALPGSAVEGVAGGVLLAINRLLFWLVGASDSTARLLPALAGTALPLAPLFFRGRLGRRCAVIAGGLLAISPSMVRVSRTVDGAMLGVAAACVVLGLLLRYTEIPHGAVPHGAAQPRWLWSAAIVFGVGLASGSAFYSMLLVMAPALLLARPAGLLDAAADGLKRLGWVVAAAVALGGTLFFFFPAGLGAIGEEIGVWLTGFDLNLGAKPFGILLVYELFILVCGLIGLIAAWFHSDRLVRFFMLWSLFGLLVALLRPTALDAPLLVLFPLAVLAGIALDRAAGEVRPEGYLRTLVGGSAAAMVILGTHIFVSLGQYARFVVDRPDRAQASLLLVGLSAVLAAGVLALVWTYGQRLAMRCLAIAAVILFSFYSFGKAWELGHTHQADPRELWSDVATAPGARLLVETLKSTSERHMRSEYAIPVTVHRAVPHGTVQSDSQDPLLRWYLRDFAVTWVERLQPAEVSEAVVTPKVEEEPLLGSNYLGMDLALEWARPVQEGADAGASLRWLLMRDGPSPVPTRQVIIWIRQDVALAGDN